MLPTQMAHFKSIHILSKSFQFSSIFCFLLNACDTICRCVRCQMRERADEKRGKCMMMANFIFGA